MHCAPVIIRKLVNSINTKLLSSKVSSEKVDLETAFKTEMSLIVRSAFDV